MKRAPKIASSKIVIEVALQRVLKTYRVAYDFTEISGFARELRNEHLLEWKNITADQLLEALITMNDTR